MIDQQIIGYIVGQRKVGQNDDQIKKSLFESGWPENDVAQAFADNPIEPPEETKPESHILRTIIMVLIIIILTAIIGYGVSRFVLEPAGVKVFSFSQTSVNTK